MHCVNWVVDMFERNGQRRKYEGGGRGRGGGQLCQNPDILLASPSYSGETEEEQEEGPHLRLLTCDDRPQ